MNIEVVRHVVANLSVLAGLYVGHCYLRHLEEIQEEQVVTGKKPGGETEELNQSNLIFLGRKNAGDVGKDDSDDENEGRRRVFLSLYLSSFDIKVFNPLSFPTNPPFPQFPQIQSNKNKLLPSPLHGR